MLSCGEGFRKIPLGGHLRTYWRERMEEDCSNSPGKTEAVLN